jgi:predicted NBD/HSP70 family sugar kinase
MNKVIGKPQVLKEVNSSMIEQIIYERGPLSKPELAKLTSLSLPTVGKLVDSLEKNARLCKVGLKGHGAGRKAMLYETNRNAGCILAIFFYQGGKYRCRIADMLNNTIYETFFPLDISNSQNALNSTIRAIDSMIEQTSTKVKAIGIGLPSIVKPDGKLISIPQITPWEGFNLEKNLIVRYKTNIYIENIAKLFAVGYYHIVLREKQDNIVYVYVGNGIGSGLIINKQLYRGSTNSSGEIGFMASLNGRIPSRIYTVSRGYMETHLNKFVDYDTGELRQKDNSEYWEEIVNILSMICINHVAVLNPEVIVFGGSIFNKTLIEDIGRQISYYLPEENMPQIMYDDCDSTGIEGLILTCRSHITTEVQLIQNTGRIRRRTI